MGAVNIFVDGHGVALAPTRVLAADASRLYMNTLFDARIGNVTLRNGSTWTSDRALANYDVLVADNSSGASTVLVTGTGASYMNGAGGIHLQGVQNFTVEDTTSSADPDLVVSMIIAAQGSIGGNPAGIRKQGAGTMALLNANTFNGAFLIESGAVLVGTNTTTGTLGPGR
jgi:autotransporter-associated beta strand protein